MTTAGKDNVTEITWDIRTTMWHQNLTLCIYMMMSWNGTFSELLLLSLCTRNSPFTSEFPAQSQWRGALMFSLICARINGWVNNGEAGDLRRHHTHHYDTVKKDREMKFIRTICFSNRWLPSIWYSAKCRWQMCAGDALTIPQWIFVTVVTNIQNGRGAAASVKKMHVSCYSRR